MSDTETEYNPGPWTCFHCAETFTDPTAALEHFGDDMLAQPGCQIKAEEGGLLKRIREQEAELDRYRNEDTDLHRQIHAMRADHATALIREEERGYEKGLRDGRALLREASRVEDFDPTKPAPRGKPPTFA